MKKSQENFKGTDLEDLKDHRLSGHKYKIIENNTGTGKRTENREDGTKCLNGSPDRWLVTWCL